MSFDLYLIKILIVVFEVWSSCMIWSCKESVVLVDELNVIMGCIK